MFTPVIAAQPVASEQTRHQRAPEYVNATDNVLQQPPYEPLRFSTPQAEPSFYQPLSTCRPTQGNTQNSVNCNSTQNRTN